MKDDFAPSPPPPEPKAPIDEELPPPQSSSEEVPVPSLGKNTEDNSKSVTEEGEIHQSKPSACSDENLENKQVSDPQVTKNSSKK